MSVVSGERQEQTWLGSGQPRLPRVNLLPPELGERRRLRHVQAALAGVGVAALAAVVVLYLLAASSVTAARADLRAAEGQRAALQRQVDGYQNVRQVYALVDQTHGQLQTAGGAEILWTRYLADLSLRIPDGIWLTKLTVTAGAGSSGTPAAGPSAAGSSPAGSGAAALAQIQFDGVALARNDVASWLEMLAKEHGWSNPYFSKSELDAIGDRSVYNFTSTVTVNTQALSDRYTTRAGG